MKRILIIDSASSEAYEFSIGDKETNLLAYALDTLVKAQKNWPDPVNLHESLGLIREEYKEFESLVFLKQSKRDQGEVLGELADIIAMCLRAGKVDIRK